MVLTAYLVHNIMCVRTWGTPFLVPRSIPLILQDATEIGNLIPLAGELLLFPCKGGLRLYMSLSV